MDKLKMHSPDLTDENIAKIREVFPDCVTEAQDENGKLRLAVDFDQLRQELSDSIVEGPQERYRLDWPGKREALLAANAPIAKTLRPCREESVDFDSTQNLFIEGDNLDALKLLQETYLGKVKMIYIDPPYNTGNDFVYADDFAETTEEFLKRSNQKDEDGGRLVANPDSNGRFHSDWLSMMYARLRLAKNLLADDGAICVHIDEHEYPNLEKTLSEVFGEQNNIGTIVWDKRNPKGDAKGVAQQHELISIYARDISTFKEKVDFRRTKRNTEAMMKKAASIIAAAGGVNNTSRRKYKSWIAQQNFSGGEKAYNLLDDNGNIYRAVSMAWPNKKKAPDNYFIPLIHPKTGKECPVPARGWRNPPATMKSLMDKGQILFGADEVTQPIRKYLLSENTKENIPSLLYYGGSDDALFEELNLMFDNPKPVEVARQLIQPIAKEGDVILDFFAGSATTAHTVMQLNAEDSGNRKFVMVQLPEETDEKSEAFKAGYKTIAEIGKERIRRAGKKIKDELERIKAEKQSELLEDADSSFSPDPSSLDIGFRVLKIDTSNMKDVYYTPLDTRPEDLLDAVDNIKPDRTHEDLLFQVLVDWGVDLTLPIRRETITVGKDEGGRMKDDKASSFTVYFVDDNALVACFESGITEALVKELAKHQPLRVVFRDNGFVDDATKINVEQIFRQLSPSTEVKAI